MIYSGVTAKWSQQKVEQLNSEGAVIETVWLFVVVVAKTVPSVFYT